jgi:hypothetical protein
MARTKRIVCVLLAAMAVLVVTGCSRKPGGTAAGTPDAGVPKLEEVHASVMAAEQKLGELRAVRIGLEKELEEKKKK